MSAANILHSCNANDVERWEPRRSDDNRFKASRALSVINVPKTRRGWYFIAMGCLMAFFITVILQQSKTNTNKKSSTKTLNKKALCIKLALGDGQHALEIMI